MSTLDTAEQGRSSRTAAEWLWPLLPIGASVFCLSALFYFHVNHGAVNPTSPLQRVIASLYRTFGLAPAVMFFFLLGTWSTIWFVTGKFERPFVRVGRLVAMAVMLGVFLNLGEGGVTAAVHKGELGAWLAGTLVSAVGYFPSIVMVWAITFASLLLATDFFFSDSFERMRTRPAAPETGVEAAVTDHLRGLQTALQGSDQAQPAPHAAPPVAELGPEPTVAWAPADTGDRDATVAAAFDQGESTPAVPAPVAEAARDAAAPDADSTAPVVLPAVAPAAASDDLAIPFDSVGERDGAVEPVVAIPRPDAAAASDDRGVRQQNLFAPSDVDDALVAEALELITGARRVTASLLQRRLRIDYAQALDLLAQLAARGKVELEADASQGRVLV